MRESPSLCSFIPLIFMDSPKGKMLTEKLDDLIVAACAEPASIKKNELGHK